MIVYVHTRRKYSKCDANRRQCSISLSARNKHKTDTHKYFDSFWFIRLSVDSIARTHRVNFVLCLLLVVGLTAWRQSDECVRHDFGGDGEDVAKNKENVKNAYTTLWHI